MRYVRNLYCAYLFRNSGSALVLGMRGSSQSDLSGGFSRSKKEPIIAIKVHLVQHFECFNISGGQNSLSGSKRRLSG